MRPSLTYRNTESSIFKYSTSVPETAKKGNERHARFVYLYLCHYLYLQLYCHLYLNLQLYLYCCHRKNQSEVSEGASRTGKVIDAEGTLPPSTAAVCASQLRVSQSL